MKTVLSILLLSMTAFAADPAAADRLKEMLEERAANARAARMTTDQRIDFYRSLVASKPENGRYKILLAASFLQKMRETTDFGYIERASRILDGVLAADASDYDALSLRAQVQLEYHQFSKAADTARGLIHLAPKDPLNWGALADALVEMGDYDAAGDAIQKMVDLRPDLASYNRAAHYRFLFNDAAGAIGIMRRAVGTSSSSSEHVSWCLVELGDMYFKTGRIDEARDAYQMALRSFPSSHRALAALARLDAASGDVTGAVENYRRAQAISPLPDYAAALYDLYSAQGNAAAAQKQRDTIDLIDRLAIANNEKVNRNLSLVLAAHNWRPARALQLAQAELEFRRDVYSYDALAWAYYSEGDFLRANQAIQKALALRTPEPQFYLHAACIAQAQGETQAAAAYLKMAANLNPLWPGVREAQRSINRMAALE